jgi:hypothetical protein
MRKLELPGPLPAWKLSEGTARVRLAVSLICRRLSVWFDTAVTATGTETRRSERLLAVTTMSPGAGSAAAGCGRRAPGQAFQPFARMPERRRPSPARW